MLGRLRDTIRNGLRKTRESLRERIGTILPAGSGGREVDEAMLDELEEALVLADLGAELAMELRDGLEEKVLGRRVTGPDELARMLEEELLALLPPPFPETRPESGPRVTLLVGVNGSGKTTTTGKLAARWAREGRKVVVAAADTFRAAAVEQLVVWGERAGARVIRAQHGADPAAVAFDAARAAAASGADELLVDTAGRLHNKKPLMDELAKISRSVAKTIPGAPHDTLLVLDGTTGRNAVLQAREFARVTPVTGLVLTKLDGTAKGGVAIAIGRELGLPVRYVGMGEGVDDLLDFDAREYVRGLLEPAGGTV